MPALLPNVDPDGLLEFSVVYTDRALNHMSKRFQGVMKDISSILKEVYKAKSSALGGRSYIRARMVAAVSRSAITLGFILVPPSEPVMIP